MQLRARGTTSHRGSNQKVSALMHTKSKLTPLPPATPLVPYRNFFLSFTLQVFDMYHAFGTGDAIMKYENNHYNNKNMRRFCQFAFDRKVKENPYMWCRIMSTFG